MPSALPFSFAKIQDIRDIKDPVVPSPNYLPMVIPLIFALLAALLIYRVKKGKRKAPAVRSPHETTLGALAALKKRSWVENGNMTDYYVELSNIIRRYLGMRLNYGMMAGMTTEEFLSSVRKGKEVSQDQEELVEDFLVRCDSVKFAGFRPSFKEAETAFETAMKIVTEIGGLR